MKSLFVLVIQLLITEMNTFVSDMKSLEIEILMLESEMHHMKGWDDQGVMMDTHR